MHSLYPLVESHKVCNEKIMEWIKTDHPTLLKRSQKAGLIFLKEIGFSHIRFEVKKRVDVEAISPDRGKSRIELKLISMINEAKGRVKRAIRETIQRLDAKQLTHLLFLTLLREKETDDKHFIKVKGYCLLGIFVSKSELIKTDEDQLAIEVAEEVGKYLNNKVELISISKAEFLENLKMEEERIKAEEQTKEILNSLKSETEELRQKTEGLEQKLEQKVEGLEQKLEQKVEGLEQAVNEISKKTDVQKRMVENQGKAIEQLDMKITKTQDQLEKLIALLSKKLG